MNIVLVLPDEKSAFVMLRGALESLGHQVQLFFYRSVAAPTLDWSAYLRQKVRPVDFTARMNACLIETVRQRAPDLVFVNKGEIIFPETIKTIKNHARVAAWYVDSPLWFNSSTHHIAYSLQHYDTVFVFDGHYIPEIKRWGCSRAEVLSFGCDPSLHRTVELTAQERTLYGSQVCFVGNYHGTESQREHVLSRLLDCDLKIWGDGWQYSPNRQLREHWMGRAVSGMELAKVYTASQLTLNITYPHSISQPNMRTFEAPACGILLINDHLQGLGEFFEVGKEIEVYSELEDLRNKIGFYLAHPDQARLIAEAGQRRAHRDHTYVQRMRQMLDIAMGS